VLEGVLATQRKALGPEHPDALITMNFLADVDLQAGRFQEARALYEQLVSARLRAQGPKHPETLRITTAFAWVLVANPHPEFRDPVRAAELARGVLAQAPDSGGVWNTLGVAQYQTGRWAAAETSLTRSMALRHGGDANDYFFMAMSEWRLGRRAEARTWYEKGVDDMARNGNPDLALARFRADAERLLGPAAL
jgi:tetratricopeptide (TPR) repeat protein